MYLIKIKGKLASLASFKGLSSQLKGMQDQSSSSSQMQLVTSPSTPPPPGSSSHGDSITSSSSSSIAPSLQMPTSLVVSNVPIHPSSSSSTTTTHHHHSHLNAAAANMNMTGMLSNHQKFKSSNYDYFLPTSSKSSSQSQQSIAASYVPIQPQPQVITTINLKLKH